MRSVVPIFLSCVVGLYFLFPFGAIPCVLSWCVVGCKFRFVFLFRWLHTVLKFRYERVLFREVCQSIRMRLKLTAFYNFREATTIYHRMSRLLSWFALTVIQYIWFALALPLLLSFPYLFLLVGSCFLSPFGGVLVVILLLQFAPLRLCTPSLRHCIQEDSFYTIRYRHHRST